MFFQSKPIRIEALFVFNTNSIPQRYEWAIAHLLQYSNNILNMVIDGSLPKILSKLDFVLYLKMIFMLG